MLSDNRYVHREAGVMLTARHPGGPLHLPAFHVKHYEKQGNETTLQLAHSFHIHGLEFHVFVLGGVFYG